jgi:hypothetical protein
LKNYPRGRKYVHDGIETLLVYCAEDIVMCVQDAT